MNFQEFWKQRERMCNSYDEKCVGCEFKGKGILGCVNYLAEHPVEAEQIVEQWAKGHPILTNGDKFKEIFGRETIILSDDLIRSHNYYESLDE